jgi:hypothetical protein
MYKHYYRREIQGGLDLQSSDIRNFHKDFTNNITSVMAAKVEIVFGKYNRLCYLKSHGPRLQEFPLWLLLIPLSIYIFLRRRPRVHISNYPICSSYRTFLQELKGRLLPEDGLEMQCRCKACTNLQQYQSHILRMPYQEIHHRYRVREEKARQQFCWVREFQPPYGRNGDFGEWGYLIFVG